MMVTFHSNKFTSSARPAEKPSTGRFVSSADVDEHLSSSRSKSCSMTTMPMHGKMSQYFSSTFELLLQQQGGLVCHSPEGFILEKFLLLSTGAR